MNFHARFIALLILGFHYKVLQKTEPISFKLNGFMELRIFKWGFFQIRILMAEQLTVSECFKIIP